MKKILILALMLSGIIAKAQSLTTQDKLTLTELVSKWNLYTDASNLAKLPDYMALWATDAPVLTNPFGKFEGKAAIEKWQKSYNVTGGPVFGKRHVSTNIVSESAGKNGATVSFNLFLYEVNEIPAVFATSATTVKAIKENGDWKIQTYTIALDPGFGKMMAKLKEGK